ncbi:MAG: fibronectin type III domain-containing protein, partial [Bacteroidota bacterium]
MTKNYPSSLFIILTLALFFFGKSKIQAQTNISGIINAYTEVLGFDQCEAIVNVADASAFSAGMSVLLIQMQGASINESNSSAFGSVVDFGSAGFYERNEISSVAGNEITLRYSLLNNYDIDGSVQLVTIPTYEEAVVNGVLTAQAWNGTTGGVVVFDGGEEANISEDIDVQGLGFRGGQSNTAIIDSCSSVVFGGFANAFFYPLNDWRGAQKGEGIAKYIAGKEAGQAAQLNGGGGANDHRAGGGGGAHNTPGGQGGLLESLDACGGEVPGQGGNILPLNTSRLFMGGGGGGGHANQGGGSNGGNGGGIVIVFADLISGGGTIRVSGEDAATAQEGAGGGGAAGTVVLFADEIRGRVLIEANGGDGGDTDSQGALSCAGPGGGGSAGRIYVSTANTTNPGMSGGLPGQVINSTGTCNGSNMGATQGFQGTPRILEQFPQNLVEAPHIDSIAIGTCANVTGSSIQFGFDYPAASYLEYSFAFNDSPSFSPQDSTALDSLLFDNLNAGDSITLLVRAVGVNGCSSAFDTVFCSTTSCTGFTLAVETNIDSLYCLADDPFELEAEQEDGIFELDGSPISIFTPDDLGEGRYDLTFSYLDSLGCQRVDSYSTRVVGVPDVPDVACSAVSDSSVTFSWNATSDQYRIIPFVNGTPILPNVVTTTDITFDELMPGDSVRVELVALGVGPCGESMSIEQTCIAQDCPEEVVEIDPLPTDTFCINELSIQLTANPTGGTFSGTGVDATGLFNPADVVIEPDSAGAEVALIYALPSSEANCPDITDTVFVQVLPAPDTAVVRCDSLATDAVRFSWTHPSITTFDISYSINGAAFIEQMGITDTFFLVDNLSADDEVEFLVTPIGNTRCGNPTSTAFRCTATGCGDTSAEIMGLAAAYCVEDQAVQLSATPPGGTFSGNGVTATGLFDPMSDSTNLGSNVIRYEFIDSSGCAFRDTVVTEVLNETPAPVLSCEVGTNQITFSWTHATADSFSFNYFINAELPIGPIGTSDTSFTLTGLMAGDGVFFSVQAIVRGGCGDSAMSDTFCEVNSCSDDPPIINNLAASYCTDES